MKTLTEILDEMKLLDAVAALADKLPQTQTVTTARLSLHVPGAILDGVEGVTPTLYSGHDGMRMMLAGEVLIGRVVVQFLSSRPATAEDVLAMLPHRDVKPAIAPAVPLRVLDTAEVQ